jgi:hypothetical protein
MASKNTPAKIPAKTTAKPAKASVKAPKKDPRQDAEALHAQKLLDALEVAVRKALDANAAFAFPDLTKGERADLVEWTYDLTGDAIGVVLDGALASAFLTLVDESDDAEEVVVKATKPAKKTAAKKK